MYYTYILRCEDNSLYTGITTDLDRRIEEHSTKGGKCAKYTLRHTFKRLEAAWQSEDRKLASKLEYYIKTLPKLQKEKLIKQKREFKNLLPDRIEYSKYKRIKI